MVLTSASDLPAFITFWRSLSFEHFFSFSCSLTGNLSIFIGKILSTGYRMNVEPKNVTRRKMKMWPPKQQQPKYDSAKWMEITKTRNMARQNATAMIIHSTHTAQQHTTQERARYHCANRELNHNSPYPVRVYVQCTSCLHCTTYCSSLPRLQPTTHMS